MEDDDVNAGTCKALCKDAMEQALKAWAIANPERNQPDMFQEETFAHWGELGVFFRPSQYGFLQQIQSNKVLLANAWPQGESAFTLFNDLVLLQKLVRPDDQEYVTYSEGDGFVLPCLVRGVGSHVCKHQVMALCSLFPHYWNRGAGMSKRWSGFEGPMPSIEEPTASDIERSEYATEEEIEIFPVSSA